MPQDELKRLLKEALIELAAEGHHTCLIFTTEEDRQIARDVVRVGAIAKTGALIAVALFILGGAALAILGKIMGYFK
jgi:hypothetical protein